MGIIEKLGITPVLMYEGGGGYYVNGDDVRKVEQQRDELLAALIDLMKGVQGLPPLTAIRGTLEKEWQYGLNVIEKACYPLKWKEIKELL